ncbi:MAG: hypothetical protein JWP15_1941 [Alphaproteobacteria bacterium]|nr:hypothetical protein [Alphaproteobacteria bacterium]
MRIPPPDGSRDPRTEDPTNVWFVHLIGRILLPVALRVRISANAVSVAGFALGAAAACCDFHWRQSGYATIGFLLAIAWLIADGLDGMIARATASASALGRLLDGICDHGVFILLYCALAASIGTAGAWLLAVGAGLVHAVQATLYEGERTRFHRRIAGDAGTFAAPGQASDGLTRLYDSVAGSLDRLAEPFDRRLARSADPGAVGRAYGNRAWRPLRLLSLLSNNMRVLLIYAACLAGDVRWFWRIELVPLSVIAVWGIAWHRRVEAGLVGEGTG